MTKSIDFKELKQNAIIFGKTWQKKLVYLNESLSRSGMEGANHWLKSHHQIEQLNEAIQELVTKAKEDDFSLLLVETTFSCFTLPEEDKGQAEWYLSAHNYLTSFQQSLTEKNEFNIKTLQSAANELKFISEANEFHQRYKIEVIQQKVAKMYQEILKSIQEYQVNQKQNTATIKAQDKIKIAEIEEKKTQAQAKIAMAETIKVKEKRLAIIEEKRRLVAEKELVESQEAQQKEMAELEIKQAEVARQAKLQDDYIKLQIEEALSKLQIEELIRLFSEKLALSYLTEEQNKTLEAFVDMLNSRK